MLKSMNATDSILKKPTKYFIIFAAIIYLTVIFFNDGFMALDEYFVGITRYIPAQNSSVHSLVNPDDVKSPLQILPMHGVAQAAYALGVTSPYWQYRSVIFVLGILNFLVLLYAFLRLAETLRFDIRRQNFLLLMFALYFGAPFALTRPMFESIAAPWLALAAVWALRYDLNGRTKDLLWGVVFVSIAFVLRQQLGFCALTFVILPILKKKYKQFLFAAALGLGLLLIAGIPDYFLRGQFHYSLLNLTIYNYQHGAEYGQKPITFYPILIFIICFTPFFFARYPEGFVKKQFKTFRSIWLFVILFIVLHSLFPQKWERFVISLVPLFIIMALPFLFQLHENFQKHRLRLILLYAVNGFLFFIASFFPPQKNLIEASRFLDQNPQIKMVHRVNDTPGWITEAFILNKQFSFVEATHESLQTVNWRDCSQSLLIGAFDLPQFTDVTRNLNLKAEFNVNLIEQLAYKTNPKNNQRRVQLSLFTGCQ
ncbi:MAG: hypothetical protein H7061_09610 [Bdellovibrionaceae bacterium]|nr:hypothetical protein [Bdellovibrio sp.]